MRLLRIGAALLVVVVAACSGATVDTTAAPGTTAAADTTAAPATTAAAAEPTTTTEAVAEGLVTSSQDAQKATVQIVAQGTFTDPEFGAYEAAGAGSGFIVDPEGIAVTNNHVVTGAGLLQVYVGGDTDKAYNAQVLGVSECADLAVIDIEGEGFPYMEWYDGEIQPGLEVFAAGFPLGDPQFTLTSGIVSKSDHAFETPWASGDAILEHDARIRPGNSGGPLVTADGLVVGVNYAGNNETDQNFAISVSDATSIVEQLRGEDNVDSIGVNGQAIDDGNGTTGIWVSSVESGSPADAVGITGGDIITRVEGVTLAADGTVADYCDVLRTHSADDVMTVEVLRYATEEVLGGQLNGEELVQTFSFAQELGEEETGSDTATYGEYVTITDDTGAVAMEVPAEWSDVDGAPYTDDAGNNITDVRAAPDLQSFAETWDTPGVILSASSDLAANENEETLLNRIKEGLVDQCTDQGRSPYEDAAYTGMFDLYTDCGDTGATYVVLAAVPAERNFLILVAVQANAERDFEALDRILRSFAVIGEV